ncbi:hypothetical protein ACLB2K_064859 [Fragaria x ananassa]
MGREVSESRVDSLLTEMVSVYCNSLYANKPELAASRIDAIGYQVGHQLSESKQIVTEKMELDLKEYEMKKNSLSKMYESLYSQASSLLVFTLQWKELEERLDSIRDETQTRFKELHEREQRLDARELMVESKANELVELVKLFDEKQKEATDTRNYLNYLPSSIKQMMKVLGEMETRIQELNGVERNMEEKLNKSREELNLIQRKIKEKSKILDLKEKQLNEIVKSIEEKSKLASEEQKKAFDMEQLEEKLKEQKKSVVEVSKMSGDDIMRKVELKIKDQSMRQKSMEEWSCNLEHKERELEVKEQQILSKAEEVDALNKRSLEEFQKEVKKQEAYSQRLQLKERQLEVKSETMEKLQQECKKQVEAKERELEVKSDTMEKLHQEREKQLEAKERQLVIKSDTMEKLHQEHEKQLEAKERQLVVKSDKMEKLHQELLKQLEAKEKHLEMKSDTMKKLHQEREKKLEAKERQLEEQSKELEFSKKQFGSQIKVNSEPLENSPAANNDANELQVLLKVVDQHERATELSCTLGTTDKAPAYNTSVASDKIEKAISPAGATFVSNLQPTAKNNIIVAPGTIRKIFGQQAAIIPPSAIKAIERFIQQKKLVKAYGRIHKFKLFHKFPPEKVLKEYVEKAMKCMENSKRKKMLYEQDQVVNKGIVDLQRAIQCIKVHNLKSQYTTESIEKQILVLQKFMEDLKNENQKKRLCSTVDPSFQQHEHKYQQASLSAYRPSGLHPDYPNPECIQKLVSQKMQAIEFIHAFEQLDKFPPMPLLKAHLKFAKKDAAVDKEVVSLRAMICCIERYKLGVEPQYSPENLRECISQLKKQKNEKQVS